MFQQRYYLWCVLAVIGAAIVMLALVWNGQVRASAPLPSNSVTSGSNAGSARPYLSDQATTKIETNAGQAEVSPFKGAGLDGNGSTGVSQEGGAQQNVLLRDVPLEGTPTPTVTGTPPTPTPTRSPTYTPTSTPVVCGELGNYSVTPGKGVFVPGTTDTGNHCSTSGYGRSSTSCLSPGGC